MFSHLECLRELGVEGNPFCKGPSWAVCKSQAIALLPASLRMLDSSEVGAGRGGHSKLFLDDDDRLFIYLQTGLLTPLCELYILNSCRQA